MRRATSGAAGRRGLIWLVMGVSDAGPRDPYRYSVDVIILDGTVGPRAVYYGRHYWRVADLADSAYVLAPGVELEAPACAPGLCVPGLRGHEVCAVSS